MCVEEMNSPGWHESLLKETEQRYAAGKEELVDWDKAKQRIKPRNFEQSGSISLWHYHEFPKNYRGYHINADVQGCAFLIGLIERFRNEIYPARKKIRLEAPTSAVLAVPNCSAKCIPASSIEFRFHRELSDDHWSLSENHGEVIIEMGLNGLNDLERGFKDIQLGEGDWSTGRGNESLWFWWQ